MRPTLAVLLITATLSAAEADPKVQARATWVESLKAGDVWTCLQLESWGRTRKPAVKLGSVLADSAVIGEVRFALPGYVSHVADLGDRVVMATSERAYVLAPDGRPLQPSVKLTPEGGWQVTSYGGQFIGICRRIHPEAPKDRVRLEFGSIKLADGKQDVNIGLDLTPAQHWGEELVVADDGSALGTIVVSEEGDDRRRVRNVAIATDATRIEPACHDPLAIGRKGAWLLARGPGNEGQILIRGGKRTPIAAGAAGAGLAAVIIGGKAVLITRDGKEVPLADTPAIGDSPGLLTVGQWLVLGSGYGAKIVSEGDLMGENVGATVEQPTTLAFWRWADLAEAKPVLKPVLTMPGDLSQAYDRAAGLWVWKDASLDLIDLTGDQPVRTHYFDAPAPIRWATSNLHCLRIEYDKPQRFALYGPDKVEVWSGACKDVQVKRRDLAFTEHRDKDGVVSRRLQWLSPDPAKRRSVAVAVAPEADRFQVSLTAPDFVLGRGANRTWWTSGFDGKALASGGGRDRDDAPPMPSCPEWDWFAPTGRYYREGARVYEKSVGTPAEPLERLQLQDAWRIGGTTLLLEGDGRLVVSGRRRGEWVDIGSAEGAQRIGLRGNVPVLLREDGQVAAALSPGPKLVSPAEGAPPSELPFGGPWRIEGSHFTPPRGRQLEWDASRLGWSGTRMHSPEGSGLFVITSSVLIELDTDAARMFGK